MTLQAQRPKLSRRRWLLLLLAALALYVLLPQLEVFRHSLSILAKARLGWLLMATVLTAATYWLAAANYCLLTFRPLSYGRTVTMQLASMFANRLLPAGIGNISVNYAYLRRARLTSAQAASTIAANDLIGLIGHGLLLGLVVVCWHGPAAFSLSGGRAGKLSWVYILAVAMLALTLIILKRWRQRLGQSLRRVVQQMLGYRHKKLRLSGTLAASIGLTLCNVASLYGCVLALQLPVSFIQVLIAFTLGIGLGTVTPTPGGLGGVEAGLVAGLVAYHVHGADALAAVLAYRLISYWLALAVGALAFVIAERRGYF